MASLRRTLSILAALCVVVAMIAAPAGAKTKTKKPPKVPYPASCQPVPTDPTLSSFHAGDAWNYTKAYKFPFYGYVGTEKGKPVFGTVIWKRITENKARKAKYPTANLPSCRVARYGTEDRVTRKASKWFEWPIEVDGQFKYDFKDTWDRTVATLSWEEISRTKSKPDQWGWYLNNRWAGHDAERAFEVQGNACKLVFDGATNRWVRDRRYIMATFNAGLGQNNPAFGPKHTGWYRVRAFLDRRAIPPGLLDQADRHDFGCGASALPAMRPAQLLTSPSWKSGFGPNHSYLYGQYIGEGAATLHLLPGERRLYNNYALNIYNPKTQFNNATYAMASTTSVAGGGMVRGIVRSHVDNFTLLDEMRYCDPNYTLRNMQITRFKKHYRKDKYFLPALYSKLNRKNVRWVFGRFDPDPATLPPEQATASSNPASTVLYAWTPVTCDR